jgi:hypothetical protein
VSEATPRGAVPADFREVLYWKLTTNAWRLVAVNLLSIPLLLVFGPCFFLFALGAMQLTQRSGAEGLGTSSDVVILLAALVAVPVLHEWAHGIAMQAFGARPQYGVIWRGLMFYATAPGHAFPRNHYLVVVLAPLVGVSALALVGLLLFSGSTLALVLSLCATVNAASASGDLWIATIVARYPPHAYVMDERDGVRVFLPTQQ